MASAPLLVFDLDGTLVDSLPDLGAALNRLLKRRGLKLLALEDIRTMIGDGTSKLVERAFAARQTQPGETDLAAFLEDYSAHAAVATRPYPGVTATLSVLQAEGWRFAICTNKQAETARTLLKDLGLADWFAAIGGGDSFAARKPDPEHLRLTVEAAGGDVRAALMTGDHANDVAVATGLGVKSIFAAWGYGNEAMAAGASAVARRFAELTAIAPRLLS